MGSSWSKCLGDNCVISYTRDGCVRVMYCNQSQNSTDDSKEEDDDWIMVDKEHQALYLSIDFSKGTLTAEGFSISLNLFLDEIGIFKIGNLQFSISSVKEIGTLLLGSNPLMAFIIKNAEVVPR